MCPRELVALSGLSVEEQRLCLDEGILYNTMTLGDRCAKGRMNEVECMLTDSQILDVSEQSLDLSTNPDAVCVVQCCGSSPMQSGLQVLLNMHWDHSI